MYAESPSDDEVRNSGYRDHQRWEWKFDSAWANSALEKLGKYLKLFTDKVELSGEVITWITIKLDEGTGTQSK